jgi:peptide/nickel transport system permease protein
MRRWPELILLTWALMALAAPWLPIEPAHIRLDALFATPGADHLLGSDELGRSVAARLISGARTSFLAAVFVVAVAGGIGSLLGAAAAWFGGVWDSMLARVIEVFLAFPGILLAIALAGLLGPGIENVVIALAAMGWVGYARLARAQVLTLRQRDHVAAAIALGATDARIIARHLLPLAAAPLIVEASFHLAGVVLAEAALSFLGLGVQPPAASWGSMIRDGVRVLLIAPHLLLAPAVALCAVVLAVNVLGERLRTMLDVRNRERQ